MVGSDIVIIGELYTKKSTPIQMSEPLHPARIESVYTLTTTYLPNTHFNIIIKSTQTISPSF
jgi:hypothetical protein